MTIRIPTPGEPPEELMTLLLDLVVCLVRADARVDLGALVGQITGTFAQLEDRLLETGLVVRDADGALVRAEGVALLSPAEQLPAMAALLDRHTPGAGSMLVQALEAQVLEAQTVVMPSPFGATVVGEA
ncbi:MAG: hypothetical protein H6740_29465 [Alphaproteobacteria bacterium]|nr:hypothetical protein [Alphaproteobacteria bacterium]